MEKPPSDKSWITEKLQAWCNGDKSALSEVMDVVYEDLKRQAHAFLKHERPNHTLQTTALAHEAYLRLIDQRSVNWQSKAHFLALAATMMRRILVNYAVEHQRLKRGGKNKKVPLDEAMSIFVNQPDVDLLALNEALEGLSKLNQRQAKIVELKYFGDLTSEQIAEVLQVSLVTVKRDWTAAKAWLKSELQ